MADPRLKPSKLPKKCSCGGRMEYAFDFGRVFSVCASCTPVVRVDVSKLRGKPSTEGK